MADPPSKSDSYHAFLLAYQQGKVPKTYGHLLQQPSAAITELIQSRHDPSHPSHVIWEEAEKHPRFRAYRLQKLADEVGIPVTTTGPDTAIIADPPLTGSGNVTYDTMAVEKACELLNEDENSKAFYEPSEHGILVWWNVSVWWPERELDAPENQSCWKPVTYYPTRRPRQQLCGKCMSKKRLFKCAGCLTMQYCSEACKQGDADGHKELCKRIEIFRGLQNEA
ncbi:hypothetical protein BU16DRAFT_561289 [Lophium mytilinum]|uniref:MYND-type domain-containing protein n=1 Tax=Lophium mytilinum TaxID=390894 RepID=A0A6A6QVP8_9PEZI|nr:hypothetical protein BU16DRAFT_561289 [Lophium mytilinum]